jgi:2-iminoacetate synthase
MSYYNIIDRYRNCDWDGLFRGVPMRNIERVIRAESVDIGQFASLLSPEAEKSLEQMARRAHELTIRHFGRTIQLYTPMYLSNYCDNECVYCGFNAGNKIERKILSLDEVDKEARHISSTGLKHILILTGESRRMSPINYIKDCVRISRKYFSSISIEVYPLTEEEYRDLIMEGVDGLTIYQEVYDEEAYKNVHASGPKRDYLFRMDAPERGAKAGMRGITIGTLFGLDEWRREVFFLGLHAKYLQDKFPDVDIGAAVPRVRPHAGDFKPPFNVTDRNIVQAILALRIFLPRLSLAVSTRESAEFRERILPLGITRMSAYSTTQVGGHTIGFAEEGGATQFEISDRRSVEEILRMLERNGYQGVLKDWVNV